MLVAMVCAMFSREPGSAAAIIEPRAGLQIAAPKTTIVRNRHCEQ